MKTLLAALFIIFGLIACGSDTVDHTVNGGVDVNANFERTELKQVNGILYVRTTDSLEPYCLSIDPSTVYPDIWQELPLADQSRVALYTNEEITECM